MRGPPDFREELHPYEIVRGPPRLPWLATIALVVSTVMIGMLLRALDALGTGVPARTIAPGAAQRAASPVARGPGAKDGESTAARRGR